MPPAKTLTKFPRVINSVNSPHLNHILQIEHILSVAKSFFVSSKEQDQALQS